MICSKNGEIFPIYTSGAIMEYYRNMKLSEQIVRWKIEDYRARHRGKSPARIFVSSNMFLEIAHDVQVCVTGAEKLFGVPVSIFESNGECRIYLSEEEGSD